MEYLIMQSVSQQLPSNKNVSYLLKRIIYNFDIIWEMGSDTIAFWVYNLLWWYGLILISILDAIILCFRQVAIELLCYNIWKIWYF